MATTKPAPDEAPEALDAATATRAQDIAGLRTGGLVSDALRMHPDRLQTLINAVRAVNTGKLGHSDLQALLDAFFGAGQVASTDVALARPPDASFTMTSASIGDGIHVETTLDDADLPLDDSNVRWVFSDGHIAYAKAGTEHDGKIEWVRCEVAVGGELFIEQQDFDITTPTASAAAFTAFDPADHTVDEVIEYVEQHPDEADAIAEMEAAGKNRVTLMGKLDAMAEADA